MFHKIFHLLCYNIAEEIFAFDRSCDKSLKLDSQELSPRTTRVICM